MMIVFHGQLFAQADVIVAKKENSIEETPGILFYINLHFHLLFLLLSHPSALSLLL